MGIEMDGLADAVTEHLNNKRANREESLKKKIKEVGITHKELENLVDEWKEKNQYYNSPIWTDENRTDGHPSTNVYLKYIEEFFPRFNTTKTRKFVNRWNKDFDHTSQYDMGVKFNREFREKFDHAHINSLLNG
jgi:hypothetical protein